MDDMERYGDYNEIDEPPKKSPALLIIKITAIILCAAVIGLLAFRLFTFNYYPNSMKRLYFTPALTEYYNETDGSIGALTQKLRSPYDDAKHGNFFCSNLIVIPEIGELQISLRYNVSLATTLAEEYGLENFDVDDTTKFSFRLWRDGASELDMGYEVGTLTAAEWDSMFMYRYCKLVFDDIDFGLDEGDDKIDWIRLEVFIEGANSNEPFMIPIYENNDTFSTFDEYKLSSGEKPI